MTSKQREHLAAWLATRTEVDANSESGNLYKGYQGWNEWFIQALTEYEAEQAKSVELYSKGPVIPLDEVVPLLPILPEWQKFSLPKKRARPPKKPGPSP